MILIQNAFTHTHTTGTNNNNKEWFRVQEEDVSPYSFSAQTNQFPGYTEFGKKRQKMFY
jgi:hypothetical protein